MLIILFFRFKVNIRTHDFIFCCRTVFSIATSRVNRPTHNGTFVYFNDATTRTIAYSMDCGWNPNVIYTGKTIVFGVLSPPWIPGHSYYITFDSGKDFLLFSILHID